MSKEEYYIERIRQVGVEKTFLELERELDAEDTIEHLSDVDFQAVHHIHDMCALTLANKYLKEHGYKSE